MMKIPDKAAHQTIFSALHGAGHADLLVESALDSWTELALASKVMTKNLKMTLIFFRQFFHCQ